MQFIGVRDGGSSEDGEARVKRKQQYHFFRLETEKMGKMDEQKHTTDGIRWWSPTQLLTGRRVA